MARVKSIEQIKRELESVPLLDLPAYLKECQFFDAKDAYDTLSEAIEEYRKGGGVAKNLIDATGSALVNSIVLVLLRKFCEPAYKKVIKSKTVDFSAYAKKALTFSYEDYGFGTLPRSEAVDSLRQDYLRRSMVRHAGNPNAEGVYEPLYDVRRFRRDEDYKGNSRSSAYVKSQSRDGVTVRGVGGKRLVLDKNERDISRRAQGDHVTPLKMIHENSKFFIERYVDLDKVDQKGRSAIQKIVNDDYNFQVLSADKNSSKGGGQTNVAFVSDCRKIAVAAKLFRKIEQLDAKDPRVRELHDEIKSLGLSDTKRKAANKIAHEDSLSKEERARLKKYKLTAQEKRELEDNQKRSENAIRNALLKEGGKTVAMEQIGRLVDVLIGPVFFEIRDSFKNGISYGFAGCDSFEAFCRRVWRAFKYTFSRLAELFKGACGDMAKMLATFFMSACKMLKDIFGKFFELALSGVSVLIEAIKILMGTGSLSQKGDAITKIMVGFVTGMLGHYLIDATLQSLGLPDPFSEIFAAILSALISTSVMTLFDQLDVFSKKKDLLKKRVEEIFGTRESELESAITNFDEVSRAAISKRSLASIRTRMAKAIAKEDYNLLNKELANVCRAFDINDTIGQDTKKVVAKFSAPKVFYR